MIRALLLCLPLFFGCASPPAPLPRPASATIQSFAFHGRLIVRRGDFRHHLKVDWRHHPERDEILLSTPLGQGVAELVRDAAGARLVLADRRTFVAEDWGALAERVFGFRLPLAASSRWLIDPTAAPEGWRMQVIEREGAAPDALPRLIELERDDIHVRLRIDAWSDVQ